jgi:hypothetical protein
MAAMHLASDKTINGMHSDLLKRPCLANAYRSSAWDRTKVPGEAWIL